MDKRLIIGACTLLGVSICGIAGYIRWITDENRKMRKELDDIETQKQIGDLMKAASNHVLIDVMKDLH